MSWLFGKPKGVAEIHASLSPEELSSVAVAMRDLAAKAVFGSASLIFSPGSAKSIRYLGTIASLHERLLCKQTHPNTIVRIQDELRGLQIELGDWQRTQIEALVNDYAETVTRIMEFCDRTYATQSEHTDRLSRMQENLVVARDSDDITQVRSILKEEVQEAQRIIETQAQILDNVAQEFQSLVRHLQDRVREAEEAAQTDYLTSLGNRAAYDFYTEATLQKVRMGEGPYSVVMMDLDGFKPVNDTHGHEVGDRTLNAFAGRLRKVFPRPTLVCRLGGDEFVVVCGSDAKSATQRIQKLAQDLKHAPIHVQGKEGSLKVDVGVSYGVAQFDAQDTTQDIYERADRAMYEMKRQAKLKKAS